MKTMRLVIWLAGLLVWPVVGQAQFTFTTNDNSITITGYLGTDGTVVVPSTTNGYPVVSIGYAAFINDGSLTNVVLPKTLTNIDTDAFTSTGLTSLTIPDGVANIGPDAFAYCSSLASVVLGNNVVYLGDSAFFTCAALTNVFIPASVTNLGFEVFAYCPSLTNITVDALNPAYSSAAGVLFNQNQTTLIEFPEGQTGDYTVPATVLSIGDSAFVACENLTNLTLPDTITNIGQLAFSDCANVTNFTLPANVATIGPLAFSNTRWNHVLIPASVTNIGYGVFSDCRSLTNISVAANNAAYTSVDGVLFDISQTTLVEFPLALSGSVFQPGTYTVPNGVTQIEAYAFEDSWLDNITLPDSITRIGLAAFYGCYYLTNLTIPDSVTSIGDQAFDGSSITNLTFPPDLAILGWFGACPSLTSIYFEGNAPNPDDLPYQDAFQSPQDATVYYSPGTTGWNDFSLNTGLPTAPWLPQALSAGFGVQTNQFGFNLNWASGQTVIVEACTNLSRPDWQPVQTNTLTTGTAYFTDLQSANYPQRFYRLRSP
jgi:hypothetical protein